jgi:DNA repair protein RadA/Sms
MSKLRLVYRCSACATAYPQWAGRCASCEAWNSMVEDVEGPDADIASLISATSNSTAMPIAEVDTLVGGPRSTGIDELDRVLGGGLVPGSVTLLGGEPGIGKSTLLLQLAAQWPTRTLYVSGEESAQQVRLRAERLGAVGPNLWLLAETSLPHVVAAIDTVQPQLVIIDSIQSVADPDLGSAPGSVVQVRGCTHRLVAEAKSRGIPVMLVGHVTKDGGLAGPRLLEHVVDTVLSFEGDRHHALRMLRAVKHRFGSTNELGVFEMVERGLVGVPDASSLFLTDRGSAQGLDAGRLALLLAVLERRARMPVGQHEVFASAVGGVRLTEPGSDLPVCLAIVSALVDHPIPSDLISFGEIGLAGELRQVAHASRRLAEAARLGFTRAIVPVNSANGVDGISLVRVATLTEALVAVGLHGARSK